MMNITLPDELAKRLQDIARRENRPLENVVESMIEQYTPQTEKASGPDWDLILGIGDESVTDMSTTVNQTLSEYFREKYGNPD